MGIALHSMHPMSRQFISSSIVTRAQRSLGVAALLLVGAFATALVGTARGGATIDIFPSGSDVVALAYGSANVAGLTVVGPTTNPLAIQPGQGYLFIGTTTNDAYTGYSGPAAFGTSNTYVEATSSSGGTVGIVTPFPRIFFPRGYTSGSPLSATARWANHSISSLGLTVGTYVWTWGSGPTADSMTINVLSSTPLTVTTASDSTPGTATDSDGQTSLREALAYAQQLGGSQTITFSNSTANGAVNFYDGAVHTITLGGSPLAVNSDVTITGPGADKLIVDGNNASRIFFGATGLTAEFSGMTMQNGNGTDGDGGAILASQGTVRLRRCTIRSCSAISSGGGVRMLGGSLRVIECTFDNNSARGGGALHTSRNSGTASLFVSASTFVGNIATSGFPSNAGGAINVGPSVSAVITGCTIVGNSAASSFGGGAIGTSSTSAGFGQMIVRNTLVAGNSGTQTNPDLGTNVTITDRGGNLIGIPNGSTLAQLVKVDGTGKPLLASNGGPIPTVALANGSPALDAGVDLSTLASAVADASATSVDVADASGLISGIVIQVESEQMLVQSVSSNTLTVTRGANSTTAVAHSTGASVNYTTDQRGLPRVQFGTPTSATPRIDIGAYEAIAPTVQAITSTTSDGAYNAGKHIVVTVKFDAAVTVDATGGTPTLALATGASPGGTTAVAITGGSGTDTLSFDYTVQAGDNAADLDCAGTTALVLNGATITNADGYSANLVLPTPGATASLAANKALIVDTAPPTVQLSAPSRSLTRGTDVTFTATYAGYDTISLGTGNLTLVKTGTAEVGAVTISGSGATRTITLSSFTGTGTITFGINANTATDAAGNGSSAVLGTVLQVDTSPLVTNDYGFSTGTAALDLNVLGNDPGTVDTFAIATQPQHGTATIVNGKIHYVPTGALPVDGDSFTYLFTDTAGDTGTATVYIVSFAALAGTYDGLIEDSAAATGTGAHQHAGYVRLSLTATGVVTGAVTLDGVKTKPIKGPVTNVFGKGKSLISDGTTSATSVTRKPYAAADVTLRYDGPTGTFVGTVASTDRAANTFTSTFTLRKQRAAAAADQLATLLLKSDGQTGNPPGTGFAAVKVTKKSLVSVKGKLADGTAWSAASLIHADGSAAIYSKIYSGTTPLNGSMRGEFVPLGSLSTATFAWFKPARPKDKVYSAGFTVACVGEASSYLPPKKNEFVLPAPTFEVIASASDIASITAGFTESKTHAGVFPPPNAAKFALRYVPGTGLFSGTFVHPVTRKPLSFFGAVLQGADRGAGYFLATPTTASGLITLNGIE